MDRPLDDAVVKQRRLKRTAGAAALGVVGLAGFAWGPGLLRPSISRDRIRTAKVDRGPLDATITASGTVLPEVEQVLSSPVDARVVRIVKRPGDVVAKGDTILDLDLTPSVLAVEKLEREVALKANQQAQTRLDLQKTLSDLAARREIKTLQLEAYRSQLTRSRELFGAGLVSQEVLHQAELAEAQASIERKQLEEETRAAGEATRTRLEGLGLEMDTLRNERREAQRQLSLATARADRAGVLTWTLTTEGSTVRKGDVIARIADLGSFRVEATVSDVHARTLRPGLPVIVRVEEESLDGAISSVNPTIQNGVMTLSVSLKDRSSPLLRANLRVDVLVVTERRARVLRVGRGAGVGGTGDQEVFVVRGDRAVKTPVRLGIAGFDRCEVTAGLTEGDEVVISDMSAYRHVRDVRLR